MCRTVLYCALQLIKRLMRLNSPEWPFILLGSVFSVAFGAMTPLFGIFFGEVMEVFTLQDTQQARDQMFW